MITRLALTAALTLSGALALAADAPAKKKPRPATRPSTKAAVIPYPLKTCVVSDEEFGGDMGDPYVFTHDNREVKLCCKSCLKKFTKSPETYLKKMDEAAKDQKPSESKPDAK